MLFTSRSISSAFVIFAVFLSTVVFIVLSLSLVGIVIVISASLGSVTLKLSFCPSRVRPTPVALLRGTLFRLSAADVILISSLFTSRPSGITSSTFMSLAASTVSLFFILSLYVSSVSFSFAITAGASSVPDAGVDSLFSCRSGTCSVISE